MSREIFRFSIGSFDCLIVNDGTYIYHEPGPLMFENAPREQLAAALEAHGIDLDTWEAYVSPYPSLVVNTGEHLVLVDTGMGPLVPTTGKLLANLRTAGLGPEDFDTVVITHAHPDHIGGNLDDAGKPAFPRARWVMWRREWDFWTTNPDLSGLRDDRFEAMMLTSASTNLPPIEPKLEFVEPGAEIVPGITAVAAPGHTAGHLAVIVSSQGKQLLALADAVILPVHMEHPEWVAAVDLQVEETVESRKRLLERAAAEEMLVFAPHFQFPSLGRALPADQGWRWQAI